MKLSKIFHFLYFSVLAIPLVTIPIFAIYSQNHEINDNTLQVQENGIVDFNQDFDGDINYIIRSQGNILSTNTSDFNITHKYALRFNYGNILSSTNYCLFGIWNTSLSNYARYNIGYLQEGNGTYADIFDYSLLSGTLEQFNDIKYVLQCFGTYDNTNYSTIGGINVFDLTQMFGEGNEPTIAEFNALFPNSYYEYTESQEMYIENAYTTTYDDTDIMSQFMYQEYNFMDKYLGIYKYQPFAGIYSWIQNTFFNANAPLVFTIFYQWFAYWLFVSLCWLVFDVLIYVPMVAHRWLDKGALE